jgi:hypothetical protein
MGQILRRVTDIETEWEKNMKQITDKLRLMRLLWLIIQQQFVTIGYNHVQTRARMTTADEPKRPNRVKLWADDFIVAM